MDYTHLKTAYNEILTQAMLVQNEADKVAEAYDQLHQCHIGKWKGIKEFREIIPAKWFGGREKLQKTVDEVSFRTYGSSKDFLNDALEFLEYYMCKRSSYSYAYRRCMEFLKHNGRLTA